MDAGEPPLGLHDLEVRVTELARVVDAPYSLLPTFGISEDLGRPYIIVDGAGYHFIAEERGNELEHVVTRSLDELLETIFVAVTHDLAGRYEVVRRVRGKDPRRVVSAHQRDLLAKLSPAWAARRARRQQQILAEYPFRYEAF